MEPSPPLMSKKLGDLVRLVFFMLQRGVSKSKVMLDLNLLMKRGKIVRKVLSDLILRQHTALSCRSHDVQMSYVSPREYEFSCSSSPAYQAYAPFHVSKHKHRVHHYTRSHAPPTFEGDVAAVGAVKKVAKVLCGGDVVEGSSPVARLLRITDSPCQVDKAAEEFIERFYKELRLQKWMAALEAEDQYV